LYFDRYTIIAYTAFVLALVSVLFGVFWTNGDRGRYLLWSVLALCAGACGAVVMAVQPILSGRLPLQLGTWFILLANGLAWQAMRALYARPPRLVFTVFLPSLWFFLAVFSFDPNGLMGLNALVRTLVIAIFQSLAAYESWKARGEKLPARAALFWTFTGFAIYAAARLPFVDLLPMPLGALPTSTWAIIVYNAAAVTEVLMVGASMIALSRERVALKNYQMAMLDPLTGISNRRAFNEAGTTRNESGEARHVVLMLMDIDHFKSVNDSFGHDVGDEVIKLAARTAVEIVAHHGSVYRIGGEEFLCLLSTLQLGEVHSLAERLRTTFRQQAVQVVGHPVNATLSIGIAASATDREELITILSRADEALYRAKRGGRNQSIMTEPTDI
jgi:diguanylate cyclase (GGDEF)-like protein